jgi:hypothetical protein
VIVTAAAVAATAGEEKALPPRNAWGASAAPGGEPTIKGNHSSSTP